MSILCRIYLYMANCTYLLCRNEFIEWPIWIHSLRHMLYRRSHSYSWMYIICIWLARERWMKGELWLLICEWILIISFFKLKWVLYFIYEILKNLTTNNKKYKQLNILVEWMYTTCMENGEKKILIIFFRQNEWLGNWEPS